VICGPMDALSRYRSRLRARVHLLYGQAGEDRRIHLWATPCADCSSTLPISIWQLRLRSLTAGGHAWVVPRVAGAGGLSAKPRRQYSQGR